MDFLQISVTITGLILYWYFTRKKNKNKGESPINLNPPSLINRQRISLPSMQETYRSPSIPEPDSFVQQDIALEEQEEEKIPPSFGKLLEQFAAPTPKPEPIFAKKKYKSVAQTFKEEKLESPKMPTQDIIESFSTITERGKKTERDIHFKIDKKVKNKYAAILQNPKSLRDAFILKEVFHRKYF